MTETSARMGDSPAVVTRDTLLPAFFGEYGGQYVPDQLLPVLDELETA